VDVVRIILIKQYDIYSFMVQKKYLEQGIWTSLEISRHGNLAEFG
jgi:hypothetical protein